MKNIDREYDVLIIGAGIAGVHAAFAAAKNKADVLLATSSWETAAGLGWGPLFGDTEKLWAKALGVGATGAPASAVRRSLISKEGLAESGVALVDGYQYQGFWRYCLEKSGAITIFQDTCESLSATAAGWTVETGWGVTLKGKTVVLAVGTFLGGRVACGNDLAPGGRPGETGARNLESCLSRLGIDLQESCRRAGPTLDSRSIEWRRVGAGGAAPERARPQPVFWTDGEQAEGVYLEPVNKDCNQHYLRAGEGERLGRRRGAADLHMRISGLEKARVTKPGFSVFSLSVPSEAVSATTLNYAGIEGLFLAGRIIEADSYGQSAYQGLTAGVAAAAVSRGT